MFNEEGSYVDEGNSRHWLTCRIIGALQWEVIDHAELSKTTKLRVHYKPALLRGSETWTLPNRHKETAGNNHQSAWSFFCLERVHLIDVHCLYCSADS